MGWDSVHYLYYVYGPYIIQLVQIGIMEVFQQDSFHGPYSMPPPYLLLYLTGPLCPLHTSYPMLLVHWPPMPPLYLLPYAPTSLALIDPSYLLPHWPKPICLSTVSPFQ